MAPPINLRNLRTTDNPSPAFALITLFGLCVVMFRFRAHVRIMRTLASCTATLWSARRRRAYAPIAPSEPEAELENGPDAFSQTNRTTFLQLLMENPAAILRMRFRLLWARVLHNRITNNTWSLRHRQRARNLAFTDNSDSIALNTDMEGKHPHGHAADYRAQASALIHTFAVANKQNVAAYQSSRREQRQGSAPSRTVYVKSADFEQAPCDLDWEAPIVQFIDVVDYVTPAELALFRGKTLAMYTNQQRSLCERSEESVSYWVDEHTLVEEVKGGARYEQRPYDFGVDTFVLKGMFGFTIYNVERVHQPRSTRELIIAVPAADVRVPYWLYALVNGRLGLPAELKSPDRIRMSTVNGLLVSTASGQLHISSERHPQHSIAIDDSVATACVISSETTMGGLRRTMMAENVQYSELSCALLSKYVQSEGCLLERTPNFMYSTAGVNGDAKAVQAAPENGLEGAVCVKSVEEVAVAIKLLIDAPRNNHKFTKLQRKYAAEFVTCITNGVSIPGPATSEEIIADLKRANQAAKYDRYWNYPVDLSTSIAAMQKIENSPAVKPSRVICPVNPQLNLALARFVKPASKAIAAVHESYVVGCSPDEVAQRLQNAMMRLKTLTETDYSTMDATLNAEFRKYVEIPVLVKLFPKDVKELLKLSKLLSNMTLKYHTSRDEQDKVRMEGRNCSGMSDTTFLNTIVNMFVEYCQHRENGVAEDVCYSRIGPKSGDDGLSSTDVRPSANGLGLTIKVAGTGTFKEPKPVGFCSRIYLDLFRTPSSIHDPLRALTRLPTVVPQGKSLRAAHQNRVLGYMKEASGTVTREYAESLKRVYGYGDTIVVTNADDEYLTLPPYPFEKAFLAEALHATAVALKIERSELEAYITALKRAKTVADLKRLKKFVAVGPAEHLRF